MLSVLNKDYPSGGNTVSCATRLELWVLYVWLKTDPPPETRFKKHQLILWSELSQDIFPFWDRTLNFYQSETDKIKTFAKKSLDVAQFLYLMVTRHLSFFICHKQKISNLLPSNLQMWWNSCFNGYFACFKNRLYTWTEDYDSLSISI